MDASSTRSPSPTASTVTAPPPPRPGSPTPSATSSIRAASIAASVRNAARAPPPPGVLLTDRELRLRESTKILMDDAIAKVARLYAAELLSLSEDYRLVGNQCGVVRERYAKMSEDSQDLLGRTHELTEAYEKVPAFLDQIDALDREVAYLEAVGVEIGEYTKKLEAYAKKLGK